MNAVRQYLLSHTANRVSVALLVGFMKHTFSTKVNKIMSLEQFEQVVAAILEGKYSWACILILRFAGYNPLQYIPYRTYNRLVKENSEGCRVSKYQSDSTNTGEYYYEIHSNSTSCQSDSSRNFERNYLEKVRQQRTSELDDLEVSCQQQTQIDNSSTLEQWLGDRTALHNQRMECPKCSSTQIRKNGHRQGKQNYFCRDCGRQFIEFSSSKGYTDETKEQCLKMYVDGMGFREIQRVSGVHHTTVIQWVRQTATPLVDVPEECGDDGGGER